MIHTHEPLVSIIMPTFNREDYIGDTIRSIQDQSLQNWELIIQDDGSDDGTEDLVSGIEDKRILYYREKRTGVDAMRNEGLKKAKGTYIAFMDSDDLWHPSKLEKQVQALEAQPDAGFCLVGGYNFKDGDREAGFFFQQKTGVRTGDFLVPIFRSEIPVMPPTLLFRRDCLHKTGLFRDVELAHVDFMFTLARYFHGVLLYEPLFYRRLHDKNFSTIHRIARHHHGIRTILRHRQFVPRKLIADLLFRSHIRFGEECLAFSQQRPAIREFMLAWRWKPLSIVPVKKIGKAVLTTLLK